MSPSIKALRAYLQKELEAGQAMVEAGLLVPLLVFMLLAVGFLGFAVYEQENVLIAARFAAREASIDAMASGAEKLSGAGVVREAGISTDRVTAAREVLGKSRKVSASAPSWRYEAMANRDKLTQMVPIGNFGRAYIARNGKMGIGFIMYGNAITSNGPWLDALANGVNETSKGVSGAPIHVWNKLGVKAEAYMPGELPIRGPKIGLSDLNPWIRDILAEPVR